MYQSERTFIGRISNGLLKRFFIPAGLLPLIDQHYLLIREAAYAEKNPHSFLKNPHDFDQAVAMLKKSCDYQAHSSNRIYSAVGCQYLCEFFQVILFLS